MKKTILMLLLMCSAVFAFADGINWFDNYGKAQEESQKTGKPILMLFTGSDWCPYCIKMEKDAFSKPQFQKFIQENFIMFKADFPRRRKLLPGVVVQNQKLRSQYKVEAYPTVIITDAKGTQLAPRTGCLESSDVNSYINTYKQILAKIKK